MPNKGEDNPCKQGVAMAPQVIAIADLADKNGRTTTISRLFALYSQSIIST